MNPSQDQAAAEHPHIQPDSPFTRWRLAVAIMVVLSMLALVSAIYFQAPQWVGAKKTLTDYDAFHIAGTLALEGRADDAYRMITMLEAQEAATGTRSFMPWTYPPPFTLFVAGLAKLPIGIGFLLFMGLSFALYIHVIRRIAGPYTPGVMIVMLPTLVLLMRTGQNGFLTASLIGLFLLAFLQRKPRAGLPLGLMVIKPHLAVGITLVTMLERRWQSVLIAAGTVIVLLLVPTVLLGADVWQGFLDGVAESSGYLKQGLYPMFRMTSVYAFAHTLGAGAGLAMALQAAVALGAVASLVWLWKQKAAPHRLAAAICCVSLFVSPYNYDYDLAILGLAVAFVLPDMLNRTSTLEQTGLVALSWAATGYGLIRTMTMDNKTVRLTDERLGIDVWSLMAPLLLLLILLSIRVLARAPLAAAPSSATGDAPRLA